MYVVQFAVWGVIFAVSCVNWFRFDVDSVYHFRVPDKEASCKLSDNRVVLNCYDTWKCILNKCREFTGDLAVNTLVHGKLHCIDMESRPVSTVDCDVEMNDDGNGATAQQSVRPELQVPASLSERGQGRSGSEVRASRPPPQTTHPPEMLSTELGFVGQADHLDSKSGQFERSFAAGSQSSPAVKLARHMQQQQSLKNVVTASPSANPSLIQHFANLQSNEDEGRHLFSVDKNPHISPIAISNEGQCQDRFPTVGGPGTWGRNTSLPAASTSFPTA